MKKSECSVFVEEVRGFVLFEEFDDIVDLNPAIDHFRPNDDTRIALFLKIDGLDHIARQHVAELGFDHSRFGRFIALVSTALIMSVIGPCGNFSGVNGHWVSTPLCKGLASLQLRLWP